jgi:hypothetical protein
LGKIGGTGNYVSGSASHIYSSRNATFNVVGNNDGINLGGTANHLTLSGIGESVTGIGDTINTTPGTGLVVGGSGDAIALAGLANNLTLENGITYIVSGSGSTITTAPEKSRAPMMGCGFAII